MRFKKMNRVVLVTGTAVATVALVLLVVNFMGGEKKIERRVTRVHAVENPLFAHELGAMLGPAMVGGNLVQVLKNGDEIFPPMLKAIRGAQAIGRGHELGSIEVGKRADLVVFDVNRAEWQPVGDDAALQLVWGTDGRSVRHVIVAGEVIVRDGVSTRVDTHRLGAQAARAGSDLRLRAGVRPASGWPVRPA